MRTVHVGLLSALLGSLPFAHRAMAAQTSITICNVNWTPPCRDFPVTTAVPPSAEASAPAQIYSFRLEGASADQIESILAALGIKKTDVDLTKH